jgi:hypothetical protein
VIKKEVISTSSLNGILKELTIVFEPVVRQAVEVAA